MLIRTFATKLIRVILVLLIVSAMTVGLLDLVPGDPAVSVLGAEAAPEDYARVRTQLGLDRPLVERYVDWVRQLLSGDLGHSVVHPSRSVLSLVQSRLPVTLQIAGMALIMALALSIPAGMLAASRAGSRVDKSVAVGSSALISIPSFVSGLLLVYLFVFNPDVPQTLAMVAWGGAAVWIVASIARGIGRRDLETSDVVLRGLGAIACAGMCVLAWRVWPSFPRQGFARISDDLTENLRTAFLPALTIAITEVAVFTRLLRSDMATTLQEDFILSARAKGMPARHILMRDALRPSSFSLLTLAGVSVGRLMGGTVIVESIFNLPGMGRLIIQDGVIVKDFTVVQGAVIVIAALYVLINALVDAAYALLDPRVRHA